jgi:hypothetical protein
MPIDSKPKPKCVTCEHYQQRHLLSWDGICRISKARVRWRFSCRHHNPDHELYDPAFDRRIGQ